MQKISAPFAGSPAFTRYLTEGQAGRLRLPVYEINTEGEVEVMTGEVFCRVPGCTKRTIVISPTSAVRKHLILAHGLKCQAGPPGKPSQETKDVLMEWCAEIESVDENHGREECQEQKE
ncbi:hypothetical protein N7520_000563 [Penicillium odoratum]|uniref:uncharacterized protein n=1 Tax=Penicillium odoratum TaxID=1167516 RepID=UPI0025496DBB|nr:uncharacterized protein N7520_000563 [Penicillium odoratum]KAJ5777317.1 hypothetical protein N7520_000563 [Penicillium odoratum]